MRRPVGCLIQLVLQFAFSTEKTDKQDSESDGDDDGEGEHDGDGSVGGGVGREIGVEGFQVFDGVVFGRGRHDRTSK